MKTNWRLIRRNRDIDRPEIEVNVDIEGGFGDLPNR